MPPQDYIYTTSSYMYYAGCSACPTRQPTRRTHGYTSQLVFILRRDCTSDTVRHPGPHNSYNRVDDGLIHRCACPHVQQARYGNIIIVAFFCALICLPNCFTVTRQQRIFWLDRTPSPNACSRNSVSCGLCVQDGRSAVFYFALESFFF